MSVRAATYVRMSSDRQEDSPDRQKSLILPYITSKGYIHTHEYADLELRGWDESRPDVARLIRDAQAGEWDVLVVDEWSRLSRSDVIVTISTIVSPLRAAGVQLDTVKDGPKDWNSIAGQIMMVVDSFKSQEESRDIGRRTLSKMMMLAKQGELFLGPTPYGYRAEENEDGRRVRLIPGDPAEVEIVTWLFDQYANRGRGVTALARELTDKKVPAPGGTTGWHPSTVRFILTNPNYIGHYRFNKCSARRFAFAAGGTIQTSTPTSKNKSKRFKQAEEDVVFKPDTHRGLVTQELFKAAQAAAEGRRTGRVGAERTTRLLSRVLYCFHCGRVMYHVKQLGVSKWRCATNFRRLPTWEPCGASYQVPEAAALDEVAKAVTAIYTDPAYRAERAQIATEVDKKAKDVSLVEGLKRKLATIEKRIDNGYDRLLDDMTKEQARELTKRLTESEVERDRMKTDLAAADKDTAAMPKKTFERGAAPVVSLKDAVLKMPPVRANHIVRSFIEKMTVRFETRQSKSGKKQWHTPVEFQVTRQPEPELTRAIKLLVELEHELGVRFSK